MTSYKKRKIIYILSKVRQSQSSTTLYNTCPIGQLGSSFSLSEWKSYPSRTFGRAKFPALHLCKHIYFFIYYNLMAEFTKMIAREKRNSHKDGM